MNIHHSVARWCVHCCKGDALSQWRRVIFGPMWLRNPWTDSAEIWHVWLSPSFDPMHTPIRWPLQRSGEMERLVKLYFRVLFCPFNVSTAYLEKRGFLLNAPKNVFRWWVRSFWVILPRGYILFIFIPKTFSMDRLRIKLALELARNALIVDDSSVRVAYQIEHVGMWKSNMR